MITFRNKWTELKSDCTPLIQRGTPINIQKISSLLIILFCGLLCALFTLFVETIFGPALQPYTIKNSKYKMKILLREVIEDIKIANVYNSSLNSKLQDIQDLHNNGQCCNYKCKM